MSHFYVHYFLCDMGVTHVHDLRAILHINPCQVLLHTSGIPLLRWLTLWPHEVMIATQLSILHVYKKCDQVETTGSAECTTERADKATGQHQLYSLTSTLFFCFPPRGFNLSEADWTVKNMYVDFCAGSLILVKVGLAKTVSLALNYKSCWYMG